MTIVPEGIPGFYLFGGLFPQTSEIPPRIFGQVY